MSLLVANLHAESLWSGRALPGAVLQQLATVGSLLRVFIEADDVGYWAPANIELGRLLPIAGLPALHLVSELPNAAPYLAWASAGALPTWQPLRAGSAWWHTGGAPVAAATARFVADRRRLLDLAPDADRFAATTSGDVFAEISRRIARGQPQWQQWIAKAVITAAGRDRVRGAWPCDAATTARLTKLLKTHPCVVVEPWRARLVDLGQCGILTTDGQVAWQPVHQILNLPGGQFAGIARSAASHAWQPIDDAVLEAFTLSNQRVARALTALGYHGPIAIDAYTYADQGQVALEPLCEINPRLSFGFVAHALATRLGGETLRFWPPGVTPPSHERLLISPAPQSAAATLGY